MLQPTCVANQVLDIKTFFLFVGFLSMYAFSGVCTPPDSLSYTKPSYSVDEIRIQEIIMARACLTEQVESVVARVCNAF